jgi:cysteine desulfurase
VQLAVRNWKMKNSIYLDYNATTPCDKEVVEAMLPYFSDTFGNASSQHHAFGWLASDALEQSAHSLSKVLGVLPNELVFTSGATESCNTVIKGVFEAALPHKNHIITTQTEHKAVLDVCKQLEKNGAKVTYLEVDDQGVISLDALQKAITEQTALVCIMWANNETGVLQPLASISAICKEKGVLLFSDATQVLGKIKLDSFFNWVDFACFSAHKIYGPKGVGLLFSKKSAHSQWGSFIQGGGQQRKRRGGTYNIPGIVGLAKAIALNLKKQEETSQRLEAFRNEIENKLIQLEGVQVNGGLADRLPNTLNVSIAYVDGEQLLNVLGQEIAVSNGSACNSAAVHPSHVLTAMGVESSLAMASLRISLGKFNTPTEIEQAVEKIIQCVSNLRAKNILWTDRKS